MDINELLKKIEDLTPEQRKNAAQGFASRYEKREAEFKKRRDRYAPTDEFLSRRYDI